MKKMSRIIIGFLRWMSYCMPLNRMRGSMVEMGLEGVGKKLTFIAFQMNYWACVNLELRKFFFWILWFGNLRENIIGFKWRNTHNFTGEIISLISVQHSLLFVSICRGFNKCLCRKTPGFSSFFLFFFSLFLSSVFHFFSLKNFFLYVIRIGAEEKLCLGNLIMLYKPEELCFWVGFVKKKKKS